MEGIFKFKFCAEGEFMANQVATFTVTVNPASTGLTLTPDGGALPDETVGTAVNDPVTTVSGGTAPYTFQVTNGAVPDGLQLFSQDNADGSETITIEGTPTTAGSFSFDLTVTDSATPANSATATVSGKKTVPQTQTKVTVRSGGRR